MGAEHDAFLGLAGQIEQQRVGQPWAVRRSAAAASGVMPAAGIPGPSCRPDEPATS
jgi:hypothetical protein